MGIDADTAEIRLRRMLGVFSVGRVFNPKTTRSQLIGGMIWGVGAALEEEAVVDPRSGAFGNRDFAQYLVPVHADVPDVDAVVLDGFDDKANVLGAKGVGEVGICGAGAASPTRCSTPPACACATSPSPSRRCCPSTIVGGLSPSRVRTVQPRSASTRRTSLMARVMAELSTPNQQASTL